MNTAPASCANPDFMTVWRYSLFLLLYLAQLKSEHPWLKTSLASTLITLSKKGVLLQYAFGGKNYGVSGVVSSLILTKVFLNKRRSTLSCAAAHNPGSTEFKTPTAEGGLLPHSQHFTFCSAPVLGRQPRAQQSLWLGEKVWLFPTQLHSSSSLAENPDWG